jgi:hypothetical protein
MKHSKRVASEKVNERHWINVIVYARHGMSFEVINHVVFSEPVVCRISVRLLYHILFYYTVRVEIHSELCGLYGHNTTTTNPRVDAIRQLQPDRQQGSFSGRGHNTEPAMSKMDLSASFSTGGAAMEARRQLLGDLLRTVGYTSYRHSTMETL